MDALRVEALAGDDEAAVAEVAARMRATLVEVLGEARGGAMYTREWLEGRVRQHLRPDAAVFLALAGDARLGHTIVREEVDEAGARFGLFATTYVDPASRRLGVARALLDRGEAWMRGRGLVASATYTDRDNEKLIRLFESRGYALEPAENDMVILRCAL